MLMRRYCDDCFRRQPTALAECEAQPGQWRAELKQDGYRLHLEFAAEGLTAWSRRWKKHPVSKELLAMVERLSLPVGTILDGEWLARRTVGTEVMILWDVMVLGGEWLGTKTYAERLMIRDSLGIPNVWDRIKPEELLKQPEPVLTVTHHVEQGFEKYFEFSKTLPWAEGVVLKRLDSKLIGSAKERKENPGWIKVKWRCGSDGHTLVA